MASLFDGLQTQASEPPNPTSEPTSNGDDIFGSLSVGGSAGSTGPSSAFSFLNSGSPPEEASSPTADAPASASGGDSIFGFLNRVDAAPQPATEESSPGLSRLAEPAPAPAPSAFGAGSAFSFVSGGSQSSTAELAAPAPTGDLTGILDTPSAADTGPRKKTRKALLPGHASRSQETAPPPPPAEALQPDGVATPGHVNGEDGGGAIPAAPSLPTATAKPMPPPEPEPVASTTFAPSKPKPPPPPPEPDEKALERQALPESRPVHNEPAEVVRPRMSLDAMSMGSSAETSPTPSSFQPPARSAVTETKPAVAVSPQKPPPPPEPPLSPSQKLQKVFNIGGIRQWTDERAAELEKEQRSLLEQKATCLSSSQRTTDNIAALRNRLETTEADQNNLCDNEQFEEAGALDSTIQELKDMISQQLEEVSVGARQMETLNKSLLSLTRERAALTNQALEKIQDLAKESEEAWASMFERSKRRLASEEARIESERKRMGLAQSHIDKDSENLKIEWQQVTEAIDQQTTEHVGEREKASTEREALDQEIQELQRLLEKKLEQRKSLTEVVDSCDIRIASIRSKFEKQLTRLEGKKRRLEEGQREVEADAQQVAQMDSELNKESEALREQEVQQKRQQRDLNAGSRALRKQRRFIDRNIQVRVVWQQLLEPHQDALNQARQSWETVTQKCVELSAGSANQEAEAAKLRSQIDASVQALPGLEAEKKLAVASRSFKEAGRLTEEIRRREEEKKTFESQLESLQAGLASAREALATCRQGEQDAQAELLRTEESCAVEELRVLRHQVRGLEELCKRPALDSSDRRLYEQEICVAQRQQEHLSKKYSIVLDSLDEFSPETLASLEEGVCTEESAGDEDDDVEEIESDKVSMPNGVSGSLAAGSPAASGADISPLSASEAEAAKVILDPEEIQRRIDELTTQVADSKAKETALESQIEDACREENFELAEELEEQRKGLTTAVEESEKELMKLKASLGEVLEANSKDAPQKEQEEEGANEEGAKEEKAEEEAKEEEGAQDADEIEHVSPADEEISHETAETGEDQKVDATQTGVAEQNGETEKEEPVSGAEKEEPVSGSEKVEVEMEAEGQANTPVSED
mmetsp:Transcript_20363/g.36407  ORF Transcript_20363/g.36407 Transcript_20363/m.36407 type:complete len:1107 (-) Transcript_20363:84-3404(-)|eukprot:CAMPEP_0197663810 /NCGR_PEP_ID=MMETSP1338-20131121/58251_1 /TAXON_ID=43686 ORGANISM="Pelagodinium beii, Strain RCC1491" /NCGR_SAMPLE_ID=MMETSP1338 /ASSEMBLY_ACC=CAM_ASM_000754 /LENGTH=1106 /DNA_ID=CAMNT_0043242315 /DNA_START=47 /DNA_END=3367 /DNA_ORIENTATION=+